MDKATQLTRANLASASLTGHGPAQHRAMLPFGDLCPATRSLAQGFWSAWLMLTTRIAESSILATFEGDHVDVTFRPTTTDPIRRADPGSTTGMRMEMAECDREPGDR